MSESVTDADLREEVAELRERVAQLEAQLGDGGSSRPESDGFGDSRDAAVLDSLRPGDRVGRGKLEALYKSRTDIRSSSTVRTRIKDLTQIGPFENVAPGKWRYTGGRDE